MIGIGTPKSQSKIPRPMIVLHLAVLNKAAPPSFVPRAGGDSPSSRTRPLSWTGALLYGAHIAGDTQFTRTSSTHAFLTSDRVSPIRG
jgi:hypothetical protein